MVEKKQILQKIQEKARKSTGGIFMALKETIQEFKEFAIKGNVVDMAVGVIIGGAFGKIVTSFVNDLIMPIIGKLTGGADFSQLYLPLDGNHYATLADAQAATATIAYGSFLTQVLDFLIVAIVIFAALLWKKHPQRRSVPSANPKLRLRQPDAPIAPLSWRIDFQKNKSEVLIFTRISLFYFIFFCFLLQPSCAAKTFSISARSCSGSISRPI